MMKKFIYLFMTLGLVLTTACDPMEDIYDDIDAQPTVITGEIAFTLTDDDYDELNLNFGNFSNIADAKVMIPGLLVDKYPVWGDGSLATVTFKWYNKVETYSENIYELSDAEHNDVTGKTYGNFDRSYHIFDYLDATYPSPTEGDFVSLRYRYYSGGESTLTNGFAFENSEWKKIDGFTEGQYNDMEEGFPNFSSHDEAEIKIPVALVDRYKYSTVEAGEIVSVMYELYKGGGVTKSYVNNYVYDGSAWSKYNNVANETIKFGHDGSTWVPDNTIKYTLNSADYDLVGNGFYGNFDVRGGKAEEPESVRLDKINTILLNNFPAMQEGQKFVVSYNVFSGANEVWSMKVILSGGSYVIQ